MAFYRASIGGGGGGGGGGETETTLWTNPSPTSSIVSSTITLLDDLTKYEYLKIEWQWSISDVTTASMRVPSSKFKALGTSATQGPKFIMGSRASSAFYARPICYASDTTISIEQCRQVNGTGAASGTAIPIKISGINGVGGGSGNVAVGSYTPTTASESYTISVTQMPKSIYIRSSSVNGGGNSYCMWSEDTPTKYFYEYGGSSGGNQSVGTRNASTYSRYAAAIMSVSSSQVSVTFPANSTHYAGSWEYVVTY